MCQKYISKNYFEWFSARKAILKIGLFYDCNFVINFINNKVIYLLFSIIHYDVFLIYLIGSNLTSVCLDKTTTNHHWDKVILESKIEFETILNKLVFSFFGNEMIEWCVLLIEDLMILGSRLTLFDLVILLWIPLNKKFTFDSIINHNSTGSDFQIKIIRYDWDSFKNDLVCVVVQ